MNLRVFLVIFTFINKVYSYGDVLSEWKSFKSTYNKEYSSPLEDQRRFQIFAASLKRVGEFNSKPQSYKKGITYYSDFTAEEYRNTLNVGIEPPNPNTTRIADKNDHKEFQIATKQAPEALDWRDEGAVQEVQHQGACGSCWSFSALASLESILFIKKKVSTLPNLSEQHLVDCFKKSCSGERPEKAYSYIQNKRGIPTERDYPYSARTRREGKPGSCQSKRNQQLRIQRVQDVRGEESLKDSIASVGPVAVCMCWPAEDMRDYKGGVYRDDRYCRDDQYCRNHYHAVSAVGYGSGDEGDFWIIKNSHGTSFGDQGYLYLARGTNLCGVASDAMYPVV